MLASKEVRIKFLNLNLKFNYKIHWHLTQSYYFKSNINNIKLI
jgi:hypothetical protein